MKAKRFLVKVELLVQKISCPGVWLCSNGKVSLQLCMLDSTIQTDSYKPVFPVMFDEKFIFYKTFLKERRLNELQRSLGREWLCAELIQWKNCDEGVVLASFQTTLDDLLYPSAFKRSNLSGTDVDLLMEPTKLFPGTISPKLELRTKTTIEETFCDLKQNKTIQTNPTKASSCHSNYPPKKLHPKRVCHTIAYSKAQQRCPNSRKDKRPIFKYKKPEDDLILRTNPEKVVKDDIMRSTDVEDENNYNCDINERQKPSCYCGQSVPLTAQDDTNTSFVRSLKMTRHKHHHHQSEPSQEKCPCLCGLHHEPILCPICSKYECTFSMVSKELLTETTNRNSNRKLCAYCKENFAKPAGDGGWISQPEKKVCFCLPEERTCNLAQRLHERLRNTVLSGANSVENCIRDCEICE